MHTARRCSRQRALGVCTASRNLRAVHCTSHVDREEVASKPSARLSKMIPGGAGCSSGVPAVTNERKSSAIGSTEDYSKPPGVPIRERSRQTILADARLNRPQPHPPNEAAASYRLPERRTGVGGPLERARPRARARVACPEGNAGQYAHEGGPRTRRAESDGHAGREGRFEGHTKRTPLIQAAPLRSWSYLVARPPPRGWTVRHDCPAGAPKPRRVSLTGRRRRSGRSSVPARRALADPV
jgi:hypothetical protein